VKRAGSHLSDSLAQQWVDGVLPSPDAARAAEHASTCPHCSALAESYRLLSQALEALPAPEVPDDFTAAVLMRVEARERATSRERRTAVAILGGIAVALAAALILGGNGTWVPNTAHLAERVGAATQTLRLGTQVLTPIVNTLRLPIAALCAVLSLPLLFALSRLTDSSRTEAT
jgi:anti-sigma factor RsiW